MPLDQTEQLKAQRRELRNLKQEALLACLHINAATARIDVLMLQPESRERGENIALAVNSIDMAKDRLWHFGLGRKLPVRYKAKQQEPR